MKRTAPLIITALGGFALIVAYFLPATLTWGENAAVWFDILAAIAFILGGGNLLKIHLKKVSDKVAGWGYSVVCLIAFLITLSAGLFKIGVHPNEQFPDYPFSGTYDQVGSVFWWCYEYGFKPLTASMFAMLAFYVASAAFRAFRAKNFEAILLLGTAFIILLGRTAAGVYMTAFIPDDSSFSGLKIENLTVYIMQVFNTAGNRAIMIGIALGVASTSLKVLLGVDRSYLGSGEE
jgi:di/tricarboxylate transporter